MSKTELKKHLLSLTTLTKEQIVEQVPGLYDTCKPAKEYFEYFLNPNEQGHFEKYICLMRITISRNKAIKVLLQVLK